MKKLKIKLVMTLVLTSLMSSCGIHQGYMVNSAALNSGNFEYVKTNIYGGATATYVFGIGGLSKTTLVHTAKNNLLVEHPLQANQVLANLTVNWKTTYVFPFAIVKRCTITADVVEFD